MNSFRIYSILLVAAVAVATGGCDDNGGGAPQRRHFQTSNLAPCDRLQVQVDLQSADAKLARRDDGSIDCDLDAGLLLRGCHADFEEGAQGSRLSVVIDQCRTETDTLFSCAFRSGDLAALNAAVSGDCDCATAPLCWLNGPPCYSTPGVCITGDPSGAGCEECYNGKDDDGDGKTDCGDGDCYLECGVGQTTITCPSSTITTSTTITLLP